jgi:N-acetylmuramoyl-L-alanine amidase CwlA
MINEFCSACNCTKLSKSIKFNQENIAEEEITQHIENIQTPINIEIKKSNYSYVHGRKFKSQPRWIVVHYTACVNVSAKSMCKAMRNNNKASSHFYIDEKDIYSAVPIEYIAWHVGNGQCKQPSSSKKKSLEELKNYNAKDWRYNLAASNHLKWQSEKDDFLGNSQSIGVDICVKKDQSKTKKATDLDWYFEDNAVDNAAKVVAYLANLYNINESHIVRHSDCTGKLCPQPFTYPFDEGDKKWNDFISKVSGYIKVGVNIL